MRSYDDLEWSNKNELKHYRAFEKVLQNLTTANLMVNSREVLVGTLSLEFLGLKISGENISAREIKMAEQLSKPRTKFTIYISFFFKIFIHFNSSHGTGCEKLN